MVGRARIVQSSSSSLMNSARVGTRMVLDATIDCNMLAAAAASPQYIARPPLAISMTRWKRSKMSDRGWWILITTVVPFEATRDMIRTTLMALLLSRPVVGSSRNSNAGQASNSDAMETRRFSPPEIPRTNSSPMTESLMS